ncbi:sulfotransferase family protein [Maribellus mangrovi]|uniref:sulfotransferase family protein n=1 Tax=Maribellus mangrovi TaxID=3133146 RepID=UPI0030EF2BD3
MNEFKIPPVSTLAGSTLFNYFKVLRKGNISPRFYWKLFLTALIIIISTPFQLWEFYVYNRRIRKIRFKKPPVFILGHWRSGTTLLQNMLSKDPTIGFVTTYQSLFPNNLSSKWIFKTFMRINIPDKRPTDNVKLGVDLPQEDEFALCNCQSNAYYNFFYFPENYWEFFERAILHKGLSNKEIKTWFKKYDRLIKKALLNTGKDRVVIKNPVNTGRIDKLLKLYPDAKFLFIYRNPYTVFLSTQKFFRQLFPTLWLHETSNEMIDEMIFKVYSGLMELYEKHKSLIPPGNLMEIRFEEFEINPVEEIKRIYDELLKEDFNMVEPHIKKYANVQKSYKKNRYSMDARTIEEIKNHWGKYIDAYNYSLPYDFKTEEEKHDT